jgi:molecular chaperone DnaK (HSP70)
MKIHPPQIIRKKPIEWIVAAGNSDPMERFYIEPVDIVGFDFGHGETALAKVYAHVGDSEPEMLEIFAEKSQVTALATKPDIGDLVGYQALKTIGITELFIGFKPMRHTLNAPEHQQIVKRFIRKYLELLEQSGQIAGRDRTLFVVGSPSGWSPAERLTYADLLNAAGMRHVSVEKESRAAFLHLKESGTSEITVDHLMKNVLIIDIGSSTTDFTIVNRMEARTVEDFGFNLGAALIDEAIFERTLLRMKQEKPDDLKRLDSLFEQFPHFKRQCLIACREGKEKYYSIPELYVSAEQSVDCSFKFRTLNPPIEFEPCIHQEEMRQILSLPLPALDGRTWTEVFHDAIEHAGNRMADTGIGPPDLVVLTGGASRMDIVMSLCRQVFTSTDKIIRGQEPEFTIARGLARIGRIDILSTKLKRAIKSIGDSESLIALVLQHIPDLIDSLAEPLAEELIAHTIAPSLTAWREGRLKTLNDIRSDIETRRNHMPVLIRENESGRKLDSWLNHKILPALADVTEPVCRRFNIPRSVLDLRNRDIAAGIGAIVHPPFNVDKLIRSDEIIIITSMLAGIIVGMASGGSGVALLHLPIAGQVIAAIVGAVVAAFGVDAVTEFIKNYDLPGFTRKWVLPDSKMAQILSEQRSKLRHAVVAQMTADAGWKNRLAEDILGRLKEVLEEQVEKAVMWIR